MSTPQAAAAWFRAWGRAALFAAAAAAAALSLSAYTARTRTLAMRQIYFNAWHVLPGFTVFMTLLSWVVIQITISLARDYGLAQFALELVFRAVVLELIPLLTAFYVALRSGAAIATRASSTSCSPRTSIPTSASSCRASRPARCRCSPLRS
jgi:phospholipid/cholesterol/gamma-HCH transport system permease protein